MSSPRAETNGPISVDVIAFDLLSALNNSVPVWELVAHSPDVGRAWHFNSLRLNASVGAYVPYDYLLRRAAEATGLSPNLASQLIEHWGEIRPWPDTAGVLATLAGRRLAIVTNCTQELAELTTSVTGADFELVMSAERAGAFKPDPRAYQAALKALGLEPRQVLFVAGSVYDISGAGALGMPVYWANRYDAAVPAGAPAPLVNAPDLLHLPALLGL